VSGPQTPRSSTAPLPEPLADYADQLLLGTGLDANQALLIASGQLEPDPSLGALAAALRAGWMLTDDADQGQLSL